MSKVKLQEFVERTLVEIIAGVKNTNAEISPTGVRYTPYPGETVMFKPKRGIIQTVQFDVAVTTTKEGKAKEKVGVMEVVGIGGDAGISKEAINRVKFTVPVLLPSKPYEPGEEE